MFMQLQKLIDKIEFPGVDVVEGKNFFLVILDHGVKEAGILAEQFLLYFILLAIFCADSRNHRRVLGLHLDYNSLTQKIIRTHYI